MMRKLKRSGKTGGYLVQVAEKISAVNPSSDGVGCVRHVVVLAVELSRITSLDVGHAQVREQTGERKAQTKN